MYFNSMCIYIYASIIYLFIKPIIRCLGSMILNYYKKEPPKYGT